MPQPYVPKYVSPKQAAENKARLKRRLIWIAAAIPLAFMFFAFAYSDQAPAFLRTAVVTLDRSLGYPIIWLMSVILG
jgi:choline-glycine betaine transporter